MGLFSVGRFRPDQVRSPIRLHSEYTAARALGKLRNQAIRATNDARVVAALLLLAAAALAFEMALSFHV
jgi:hypothetical protein